jgi:hypothetical protein
VAAQRRPRVDPSITQNNAPGGSDTRTVTQAASCSKAELVHAGLAPLIAFAVADQQRPTALIDVGLVERQRLGDPQPTAPEHRDQRPDAPAVAVMTGLAHDDNDLLRTRRIRWILHAFVSAARPARYPGIVAGERRRPAASTSSAEPEDMMSSFLRISIPASPGRTATKPRVIAPAATKRPVLASASVLCWFGGEAHQRPQPRRDVAGRAWDQPS